MTGRRRARGNGEELPPTKAAARVERRTTALAGKWGSAQSAAQRLIVAARYAHNALLHPHAPELDAEAERLAAQARQLGDRALDPGRGHAA